MVMFSDTLWSGSGGHPWDDAHELYASAYAGNLQAPELLREIIVYYQQVQDTISPLASEMLKVLDLKEKRDVKETTGTHITPIADLVADKPAEIGWTAEPETMYQPVTESTYCKDAEPPDLGF